MIDPNRVAPVPDARAEITGVWTLDRRTSRGEPRFIRLTFYRDGRFGSLALDGRTLVYGSWQLLHEPPARIDGDDVMARLTLHFDDGGPSAEYRMALPAGRVGPLVLLTLGGEAQRLVLERALAIDAALLGKWRTQGIAHGSESVLESLELRRDGGYLARSPRGGTRAGRWTFERESSMAAGPITGVLALDPLDVALPRERWSATFTWGHVDQLAILQPGGSSVLLIRPRLDPVLYALLATWRLVEPAGAPAPQEIVLRSDGSLEVLPRAGALRAAGRWEFHRQGVRADALEGQLEVTVQPIGYPPRHERSFVVLPFARLGELAIMPKDSDLTLRYRRLFR